MLDDSFMNIAKTQLLAKIALIDGKPNHIHEANAYTLIEMFGTDEAAFLKDIYKKITNERESVDIEELSAILKKSESSEKVELLRACCYMATCNSNLSSEQNELLLQIGSHLGFAADDIELAIKSVS